MITIEVIAPSSNEDAITRIAKQNEATDYWLSSSSEKQIAIKILVDKSKSQEYRKNKRRFSPSPATVDRE